MSHLICQYCSHRNGGAEPRCAHCGAPLHAGDQPKSTTTEHVLPEHAATEARHLAAGAEKIAKRHFPRWQWRAAFGGIAAMLVLGAVIIHACSTGIPTVPEISADAALPELMRSAASCQLYDAAQHVDKCVIAADDPLLRGSITGGRDLTFYAQIATPERLAETIGQWRNSGGTIVSDGPVFAAIGTSANVLYANTRTGLRLDTGTFASRSAAQTFLTRSGLSR